MIRNIREELRDLREPLMNPDASARSDVEAGVAREVGESRFIAAACGPMQADFDPTQNAEHQATAARLSELLPFVQELGQDVRRDEEIVAALPAHPLLWYLVLAVAIPTEVICGMQLFQTMGIAPSYRVPAALGLMTATFVVVGLVRSTSAAAAEETGWRRLFAWLRVGIAALLACIIALCIGFARVDPAGNVGLPTAVRTSRLVLLVLITVGPAIAFKYAIDRLRESLKPRRDLKAHRRDLKRAEREQASLTRDIANTRQKAARWRANVATNVARYQAAYDRASGAQRQR